MERNVHDNGSAPARTVLPLDYGACSALRKLETSCPIPRRLVRTTKYGGIRVPIGGTSLREKKGTREKNDGNEDLSLDDNEKIEADSEAESLWKNTGTIRSRSRCQNGRNQTCR